MALYATVKISSRLDDLRETAKSPTEDEFHWNRNDVHPPMCGTGLTRRGIRLRMPKFEKVLVTWGAEVNACGTIGSGRTSICTG
jgi:hypothetical protein